MAVVTLTNTEIKTAERFPVVPIVAGSLAITMTAPTAFADGIVIPVTGREVIIVQNTDVGAQTFTIASVRDAYGRLGDVTTYSMAANAIAYIPLGAKTLFGAAGGTITITMSANTVKVGVLLTDRNLG